MQLRSAPDLGLMVDELRKVTRYVGPLSASHVVDLRSLLALPRYAPLATESARYTQVVADLTDLIYAWSDERERAALEVLFRIRAAESDEWEIGPRHAEIAKLTFQNERKARGEFERWLLAQFAFTVYQRGISPVYDGVSWRPVPGHTHRLLAIEAWITRRRAYRLQHRYTIEALRANQRVYMAAHRGHGRESSGLRLGSKKAGHVWLRQVPLDATNPSGTTLAFVYFGRSLTIGDVETVIFDETVTSPDKAEDNISASPYNVGCAITITIHAPRAIIPSYTVMRWEGLDDMARPHASPLIVRDDDSPILWAGDGEEQTRYGIRWRWTA